MEAIDIKSVFTTYQFDVEVVTPVHVGMAQEKNYVRGLDYVLETDGRDTHLLFLNTKKLLGSISRQPQDLVGYSAKLAAGNYVEIETYLRMKNLLTDEIVRAKIKVQGQPEDVRRFYSNGIGTVTLPGSSIKGAIRSVLISYLKKIRGISTTEQQLFGQITDNLMRYMQVGDINMGEDSIKIYSTKVFSADGNPKNKDGFGAWKHKSGKGGHKEDFSETGFAFHYEALIAKSTGSLRVNIGKHLPMMLNKHAIQSTPNFDRLMDGPELIRLVRSHTDAYLKKEKEYFRLFPNTDLNKLEPIQERLDNLISRNNSSDEANSCLLRVGAGVGFHSITGDWQLRSADHFSDWNNHDHAIVNKTRKFAFEQADEGIDFALMGFISLTLQTPESAARRERQLEDKREAAREAAETEVRRLAAEQLANEEARKPKLFEGPLKQSQELDAEIVKSGKPNKVKVYAAGYENREFDLIGYAAPEPIGKVVIVKADQLDKKKNLLQVRYVRPK